MAVGEGTAGAGCDPVLSEPGAVATGFFQSKIQNPKPTSLPPPRQETRTTHENDDHRNHKKEKIKRQPAGFSMRGMREYRPEHHDGENECPVAGRTRYQEQRKRNELGYSDEHPEPIWITPSRKVSYPELDTGNKRHLHQTRTQADEGEEERDRPNNDLFRDSQFCHEIFLARPISRPNS